MALSFPWSRFSSFHVWYRGRKDGKRGIPPIDQDEHTPYENSIQKWGEENIRRVAQKWEKIDQKLKGEYCRIKVALESALKAQARAKSEQMDSNGDLDVAQQELNKLLIRRHIPPLVYFILLIFLGASEFPLNSIVFNLFGEQQWLTLLMSSGLAVILPLFAHFIGVFLKNDPFRVEKLKSDNILLIVSLLIPIFAIAGIAYLREKYFEASGIQTALNIHLNPSMITFIFVLINLLLFTGAIILSYFYHDPELRKWEKTHKIYSKELEEDQKELARYKALAQTLNEQLQVIREQRKNGWDAKVAKADEINKICLGVIDRYRTHNLSRREEPQLPKSFRTYPEITMHESLCKLSWTCTTIEKQDENSDTDNNM